MSHVYPGDPQPPGPDPQPTSSQPSDPAPGATAVGWSWQQPTYQPGAAGPAPAGAGHAQAAYGQPGYAQGAYGQAPYGQAHLPAAYGSPGLGPTPAPGAHARGAAGAGLGQGQLSPQEERSLASMAHWLPILVNFWAPLILLLTAGERSPFVKQHAKESLNFEITLMIAYVVAALSMLVLIGFVLVPAVWIFGLVQHLQAASAANRGEHYHYKLAMPLLK